MASTNKCLAQSNKSRTGGKATKKRRGRGEGGRQGQDGRVLRLVVGVMMRVKFEATDATGKVHKRGSTSRVYSHCVVIHFAAHPPSRFWPKGVTAYSRAEWAGSRALAERSASRWRNELYVEAIEILEARQV